jgi:2-polyprenyl-3-methyl-5-hydroxy-6-metoxy-1,4-benzoquinol methylase
MAAEFDRFAREYKDVLDRSTAFSGESSEYFCQYKANYVNRLLGSSDRPKILDYGCGIGALSNELSKLRPSAKLHGFDVSEDSLSQVDAPLRSQGVFTSHKDDLHHDYDLIVISNVMHHIPLEDRQNTISELAARLRTSGRLVVFEHNPINPLTRLVVAKCPFDENAVLLRPKELKGYFTQARLDAVRRDYIVFFPKMLSLFRPAEPLLGWCPAGAQYALVGARRMDGAHR